MIVFPNLPDIEVEGIEVAEEITLRLRTVSPTAFCPSCGTASSRIQSRYTRTLRDLPAVGRPLQLVLHVRRFFCKKSTCVQKIFVERLPELCHPHAQRTKRLQKALCELGLKEGGQAGADTGSELGFSGSRDTILRLVHQSEQPAKSEPHVIGLDDWAWKRRLRYGTLICDLERGLPIDILPDRTVETVSAWLEKHPTIDTISRDGSSEYASAIKKGCHNGAQLERELRAKGYKGSQKAIYRCLATLELFVNSPSRRSSVSTNEEIKSQLNPLLALSAPQATWLFFRQEEDLKAEEQENLRHLRQASPDLETAYQLVKEFLHMVHELTGERLEEWLKAVQASHLEAFQPFVTGVLQDKDAVFAGLTLPWSNGPTEGHVNRLKLIKRSMYGRADLDLLKLRVLHHDKKSLERKGNKRQKQQEEHLKISRVRKKNTIFQCTTIDISKIA